MDINPDIIQKVIDFLKENEQYGDDWSREINELEKIVKADEYCNYDEYCEYVGSKEWEEDYYGDFDN